MMVSQTPSEKATYEHKPLCEQVPDVHERVRVRARIRIPVLAHIPHIPQMRVNSVRACAGCVCICVHAHACVCEHVCTRMRVCLHMRMS